MQSSTASASGIARRQAQAGTSTATGRNPPARATATSRSIVPFRATERSISSAAPGIGSSATRRSESGQSTRVSASRAAARSASLRRIPGGTRNTRVTTSLDGAARMQRRSPVCKPARIWRIVSATFRSSWAASARGTSSVRVSLTEKPLSVTWEETMETASLPMSTPSGRLAERPKRFIR